MLSQAHCRMQCFTRLQFASRLLSSTALWGLYPYPVLNAQTWPFGVLGRTFQVLPTVTIINPTSVMTKTCVGNINATKFVKDSCQPSMAFG